MSRADLRASALGELTCVCGWAETVNLSTNSRNKADNQEIVKCDRTLKGQLTRNNLNH